MKESANNHGHFNFHIIQHNVKSNDNVFSKLLPQCPLVWLSVVNMVSLYHTCGLSSSASLTWIPNGLRQVNDGFGSSHCSGIRMKDLMNGNNAFPVIVASWTMAGLIIIADIHVKVKTVNLPLCLFLSWHQYRIFIAVAISCVIK